MAKYRISKIVMDCEMTGWNGFDGEYDINYKITLLKKKDPFITETRIVPSYQFNKKEYYVGREIKIKD
ncbi:hypothetical protein AST01_04415 [Staphylococcus equorum]|uniref:hypothetical protein n=1 Tax=Staphylococcus equorum TaxID=246432 RepID=UPI000853E5C2|nr:hypothetical protein [Staphylococcus equorum]OEK70178.1 hypothetical protein AST01_04415 [Staphylococcus equorum]